ncbi:hypothetical protein [Qipengyuania flava]|uniref:hypothetical protein n=1 Tax=Qipengyuania flava TaxID=192812 RepID=UPI00273FE6B5|nr:hypothetical protein [Qipengyuania flava]
MEIPPAFLIRSISSYNGEDIAAHCEPPFEVAESRLKPIHDDLQKKWRRSKSEDSQAEFTPYQWLLQAGAGLDEFGRPVFKDPKDFEAAVRYLVESNRAEFGA